MRSSAGDPPVGRKAVEDERSQGLWDAVTPTWTSGFHAISECPSWVSPLRWWMVRSIPAYKASSGSLGRTNRWESVFVLRLSIRVLHFVLYDCMPVLDAPGCTSVDYSLGPTSPKGDRQHEENAWHSIWRPTTLQNDWTWLNMLTYYEYGCPKRAPKYTCQTHGKGCAANIPGMLRLQGGIQTSTKMSKFVQAMKDLSISSLAKLVKGTMIMGYSWTYVVANSAFGAGWKNACIETYWVYW